MARRSFDAIEIIPEEEAKQVASPYLSILRGCIEDGVHEVEAMEKAHPEFFHVYPAGPRATLVFWQIVNRAEARLGGLEGVSTHHIRGFLTILIADKLEIRFKKLDQRGRSRNYPTTAALHYSLQLRLTGMEEPTRATAGYQLNVDGTLKDILMVCPRGKQLEWSFSLPMDDGTTVTHPVMSPLPDDQDKPKVRPKQA